MQPADKKSWSEVVTSSYSLNKKTITGKNNQIELFNAADNRQYVSAPYLTDGGYNGKTLSQNMINKINQFIKQQNADYILIKSRHHLTKEHNNIHIDSNYYSCLLDLSSGTKHIWKNSLNQKTRNQVRKAEKQNFEVVFGRNDLLDDFYHTISLCWRDLGTPTHSKNFYKNILENHKSNSSLVVVYDQHKPIATALIIWIDDTIFHPFAGSLKRYNKTSVNNLLYWQIIQFACNEKLSAFDMGRSHKEQGTFRYKTSWGATPIPLYYHYFLGANSLLPKPFDHPFYQLATTLWKYVPHRLANLIGPKLIYKVL